MVILIDQASKQLYKTCKILIASEASFLVRSMARIFDLIIIKWILLYIIIIIIYI